MNNENAGFSLNWFYVGFVVLVSMLGLGFMAWDVTDQFYEDWSAGVLIRGGWGWLSIIFLNLFCIVLFTALIRKIYRDFNTIIGKELVSQPSIFGLKEIAWADVTDLKIFNGFGYHIIASHTKIVVTPYIYKNPDAVINTILTRINEAGKSNKETP